MAAPRRAALGGALLAGGVLLGSAAAGCGGAEPAPQRPAPSTGPSAWRVLLAYFSRPGENYWNGDRRTLQVGNTQVVAEMIATLVRADVYRIEAADPYPDSYDATVERNVAEQRANARPSPAACPTPPATTSSCSAAASLVLMVAAIRSKMVRGSRASRSASR